MLFVFFRPDIAAIDVDEWAFLLCLRDKKKRKQQLITGEAERIINNVFQSAW